MDCRKVTVFLLGLGLAVGRESYYGVLPADFLWGVATSAYQIEGAWNTSGKSEHIWDRFCHLGQAYNEDTGDVACDSYHRMDQDIQILKDMGVNHYRFSISWSRIVPNPITGIVNEAGFSYYDQLLGKLQDNNIIPMVTLFHWDLPQVLQDIGAWSNETLVEYFNHYADVLFKRYGGQVKHWITFNEPWVVCWMGYGSGEYAPGTKEPATAPYQCGHTILKSHVKAYQTYQNKYAATQKGKVGITLNSDFTAAKNSSDPRDVAAASKAQQFMLGWFASPLFGTGDYPDTMKAAVRAKSDEEHRNQSRLPSFTPEQIQRNKGSADFLGLNHYTTSLVTPLAQPNPAATGGFYDDQSNTFSHDPHWPTSGSNWLFVVPWGFRELLKWIKQEYGNPEVIVTENGIMDNNGTLEDQHRVDYYDDYITELTKGINKS